MLNLKVIIGSTRPNRFSEKALPWLKSVVDAHKEFSVDYLDLRDYPLPFYDQPVSPSQIKNGEYANPVAKEWAKKIEEADAFIILTPEYNHAPPAVLKNALDSVYAEWNNKAVGFVAYGSVGGSRSVVQLREIAAELQMASVRSAVHIFLRGLMDESGALKAGALDPFTQPLENMLTQLASWGSALKAVRTK